MKEGKAKRETEKKGKGIFKLEKRITKKKEEKRKT